MKLLYHSVGKTPHAIKDVAKSKHLIVLQMICEIALKK